MHSGGREGQSKGREEFLCLNIPCLAIKYEFISHLASALSCNRSSFSLLSSIFLYPQSYRASPGVKMVKICMSCWRPGFDPWILSGEGNGYPLQYFCMENSLDRGAWQATVPEFAKSKTNWATNTFTVTPTSRFPFISVHLWGKSLTTSLSSQAPDDSMIPWPYLPTVTPFLLAGDQTQVPCWEVELILINTFIAGCQ